MTSTRCVQLEVAYNVIAHHILLRIAAASEAKTEGCLDALRLIESNNIIYFIQANYVHITSLIHSTVVCPSP